MTGVPSNSLPKDQADRAALAGEEALVASCRKLPSLQQWHIAPFLRAFDSSQAFLPPPSAERTEEDARSEEDAAASLPGLSEEEELGLQDGERWRSCSVVQGVHGGVVYAVDWHTRRNLAATVKQRRPKLSSMGQRELALRGLGDPWVFGYRLVGTETSEFFQSPTRALHSRQCR